MKKFERRITREEVSTLKPPGYLVAIGRGQTETERQYFRQCVELLDREAKRHPGYSVRMRCQNGIPVNFTYSKRSLVDQALTRRMTRTLQNVKKSLEGSTPKERVIRRIDRVLKKAKDLRWEE